jgi:tetratricopeptide (TPR) repeat protein
MKIKKIKNSFSRLDNLELSNIADSLYERNKYEQAIFYFSLMINKDSSNADFYFKRAYSYAQIFKYEKSTKDYLKVIELNFRKGDSFFNLGCNYAAQGLFDKALYYFQKAQQLEPNNKDIEAQISVCLKNLEIEKS